MIVEANHGPAPMLLLRWRARSPTLDRAPAKDMSGRAAFHGSRRSAAVVRCTVAGRPSQSS